MIVTKKLKAAGIFVLTFLVYHVIGCSIYPVDENNYLQAPDWYAVVGIAVATVVTVLCYKIIKPKEKRHTAARTAMFGNKHSQNPEPANHLKATQNMPPFRIPLSHKKREDLAEDFLIAAELSANTASETAYVSTFVEEWDNMMTALKNLTWLEGKVKTMRGSPSADVQRLNSEFQWKLRDAIERAQDSALEDIRGKYRNSKEHKERRVHGFISDISDVRHRFSEETTAFADEAITKVQQAAGIRFSGTQVGNTPYNFSDYGGIEADLLSADLMEGHDFEYWCADLLRRLGFSNVEVTPGSGDHGVDILAKKEGIKYAIQCKRYTSDLGNTPIQEVHAGKAMYNCQVGAVMTNQRFTAGGQQLAEATGVLLWDRDWITQALQSIK